MRLLPALSLVLAGCAEGLYTCDLDGVWPDVAPWDPASLSIYDADDNPFAQPIGAAPSVHADSETMVGSLVRDADEQGFLVTVDEWTTTVFVADADTPRVDVQLTAGWAPYRTLKDVPLPADAVPDPSGDGHLVILDPEAGLEYDFWQMCPGESPRASWGNVLPMDGDGVFPTGLSARGSGFALLNGLVWPHELAAGQIDHALLMSYGYSRSGGPVAPATESDGPYDGADGIPEGARVQLDPDLDLSSLGLSAAQETIARALQEYGMIVGDHGGGVSLYTVHAKSFSTGPDTWSELPREGAYHYFPDDFPMDRFRVIDFGAQDPEPDWGVAMPEHFE